MPRKKDPAAKARSAPFPSKEQILGFIKESGEPVGKREIARAFRIKGNDRIRLKALLKDLQRDGLLDRKPQRRMAPPGHLPNVLVLEVSGLDEDGEMLARPSVWDEERRPPTIFLSPGTGSRSALAVGERILARLKKVEDDSYEAQVIRKLDRPQRRVLGLYEIGDEGGRLRPTDRRAKSDFILAADNAGGAEPGELVLAEVIPERRRGARLGLRSVRVIQRLGRGDDTKSLSLITLHEHGLISEFPQAAVDQAKAAGPAGLGGREDLRDLPLVTIDGADARDFDDAVFAEPDDNPKNPDGWRLLVAIADVAHYVQPDSPLDRAAFARGNSVYFPDRVLPMLPSELSNGWCSLNPSEDRPCMAVRLWIDRDGKLLRHRFLRGLMRSAARLTYEEVQAARDGRPIDNPDNAAVLDPLLPALYGAYEALLRAREKRGTLELDLPERKVRLDDRGEVIAIEARERLDSHRLIEEFMITANVAAARELERLGRPCMYRVHDKPDPLRLKALAEVLESLGLRLNTSQVVRPRMLTQLLGKAASKPEAGLVSDLVLRAQSQAVYSPENIGHFGLALTHYAHFTSPIRRYADLMVHRALISGLKLGKDGLTADAESRFDEAASHISTTERSAAAAERDAVDRFTAAYLKDRVGAEFQGRINGVTRFGLFVTLDENGADGLIPISTLPDDFYRHVEARHSLEGERWGRVYRLGDRVRVRLQEAEPVTGGLILALPSEKDNIPRSTEEMADGPAKSNRGRSSSARKKPQKSRKTKSNAKAAMAKNRSNRATVQGTKRKGERMPRGSRSPARRKDG